ncbi:hypothetical protein P691DRAFT_785511 [Macrolepiota fuliginosa MF-IS2]|uniref:YDG domain-containing protein n=1 Tax=Macrolepiota fuliginosa MF-IS2 TaxID=1400762 RepID=A0A9P6C158_9AGAR|nr:hypothetical protein P691DRAFT_785511 [Macrolepiota fuliginosa MF-IS2]
MAMERLRAQIMQQDQSGVYRTNGGTNAASSNSLTSTGLVSPTNATFGSTEASAKDHYGHPDGCPVGQVFDSRKACYDAKVHRATMKGIVGNVFEGAYSIVVNEGYEDDIDEGDVIWYTGAGGQDNRGGSEPQKSDQSFDHPSNRALARNIDTRHPVRVIRGSKDSKWGPVQGYRYDGLYDVVSNQAGYVKGISGYQICRFKLQRRPGQIPLKDL